MELYHENSEPDQNDLLAIATDVEKLKNEVSEKSDQINHLEVTLEQNEMELHSRTLELRDVESRLVQSMSSLEDLKQIILSRRNDSNNGVVHFMQTQEDIQSIVENSLSQILELSNDLNETHERLEIYEIKLKDAEYREKEAKNTISRLLSEMDERKTLLNSNLFVNPDHILNSKPTVTDPKILTEAIRNALSQISRLQAARKSQLTKYDTLQRKYEELNCELNSAVDALRRQKHEYFEEKKNHTSEIARLRTQLATSSLKSTQENSNPTQIEQHAMEEQLAQQRETYERQIVALRGQLAEISCDCRSLKFLLAKQGGSQMETKNLEAHHSSPCSQCVKLQSLVDLLQRKHTQHDYKLVQAAQGHLNSILDQFSPEFPKSQNLLEKIKHIGDLIEKQKSQIPNNSCESALVLQGLYGQLKQEKELFEKQKLEFNQPRNYSYSKSTCADADCEVELLRQNLDLARKECHVAEEQVRSCNIEFLNLREQLTSAIFERDHTKELLHDSNRQVGSLEIVVRNQTQEIQMVRQQLDFYKRNNANNSGLNPHVLHLGTESETEIRTQRLLDWSELGINCKRLFEPFINRLQYLTRNLKQQYFSIDGRYNYAGFSKAAKQTGYWVKTSILSKELVTKPRILIFLLCYVALLHFLIIRCLLFEAVSEADSGSVKSAV